MAVPEEVRKVSRPKGTVVCDGRNGVYPVREKLSGGYYVDDEGKRHRPSRNGKVVGHIVDNKFVEKEEEPIPSVALGDVELKSWGEIELMDRLNRNILDLLRTLYNEDDATMIYCMALLRATHEGIPDRKLQREYEESFLTEMFQPINLRRTYVSTFLRNVGHNVSRINRFMRSMVEEVGDSEHMIIDGSLRQDHSNVNSLSEISRKTSKRGYKEVLLMYAYSMERRRPICSKVYPGNMKDETAVDDFVKDFGISNGIIVVDKGFPPESIIACVESNEELHYILPLKKNRKVIDDLDMYAYDARLGDSSIQCKKAHCEVDGRERWYYSYRDPEIAADQETIYMSTHKGKDFKPEVLNERRIEFGSLVFESDMDLDLGVVYEIYNSRWLIEIFFRTQQTEMGLDTTGVQSDYNVIASNFVDYLASIMVADSLTFFDDLGLLEKNTYGDLMNVMRRMKMTRTADGQWRLNKVAKVDLGIIEKTGLLVKPIIPKVVKKRGRKPGSKDTKPRKRRTKAEIEESSS